MLELGVVAAVGCASAQFPDPREDLMQVLRRVAAVAEIPGDMLEVRSAEVVPVDLHLPRLGMRASRVGEHHRADLVGAFPAGDLGALHPDAGTGRAADRADREERDDRRRRHLGRRPRHDDPDVAPTGDLRRRPDEGRVGRRQFRHFGLAEPMERLRRDGGHVAIDVPRRQLLLRRGRRDRDGRPLRRRLGELGGERLASVERRLPRLLPVLVGPARRAVVGSVAGHQASASSGCR